MHRTQLQSAPDESTQFMRHLPRSIAAQVVGLGVSGVLAFIVGCSSSTDRTSGGSATHMTTGGGGTGGAPQVNNGTGGASSASGGTGGKMGTSSGGAPNVGSGGIAATGSGGGGTVVNTGWWDPAWTKRRVITVQGPQSESLLNFPVPVKLGADFDFASAKGMGEDIRFTDASGTPLDSEIESWSATEAVIWVRVPSLPPMGQSVELRMYYGNTAAMALPATSAQGVWSADSYIGVWHLANEKDSGVGAFNGTKSPAGAEFVPGKVGGSLQVHFSQQGHMTLQQGLMLLGGVSVVSFSGWVNQHNATLEQASLISVGGDDRPEFGGTHPGHPSFEVDTEGEGFYTITNPFYYNPYATEFRTGNPSIKTDVWTHLAVVVDISASLTLVYQDGIQVDMQTGVNYMATKFADGFVSGGTVFGGGVDGGHFIDATMDEFRLQKVPRSAEWVKAEFASMTSPTFAMVGGLETH